MWTDLEREIIRCIKCGACQSVCPIFQELGAESSVARGKIRLMKAAISGEVSPHSQIFAERMSLCLLCNACTENCPSGVNFSQLMVAARTQIAQDEGLPWLKRVIFRWGLKNRQLFDRALKFGSLGQWMMFRRASIGPGMLPRLTMGLDERRLIAPITAHPFRSLHPEKVDSPGATRRVAFFTGCMINYMYPEIGDALLKVLRKNQISVVIPARQHCCGRPAYANGDAATATELARAVVDTFADLEVDAVITACGSCGAALREEYPELLKDVEGYREKSLALARKTMDFTELLAEIGLSGEMGKVQRTITYHDSCHLARIQGVKKQPRQVLTSIAGVVLKEMRQPGRCCGGAGGFSLQHYDIALKIDSKKVEDIVATGAEVVVTGCPMCVMHIRDGMNRSGVQMKVMHTAELIAEAYQSRETED